MFIYLFCESMSTSMSRKERERERERERMRIPSMLSVEPNSRLDLTTLGS